MEKSGIDKKALILTLKIWFPTPLFIITLLFIKNIFANKGMPLTGVGDWMGAIIVDIIFTLVVSLTVIGIIQGIQYFLNWTKEQQRKIENEVQQELIRRKHS